jgi:hypothetical protein
MAYNRKVKVTCICGRVHNLIHGGNNTKTCRCGTVLRMDAGSDRPIATIPESSIQERRANGHKVKTSAPLAKWRQ